jgi:hypothetical protein
MRFCLKVNNDENYRAQSSMARIIEKPGDSSHSLMLQEEFVHKPSHTCLFGIWHKPLYGSFFPVPKGRRASK